MRFTWTVVYILLAVDTGANGQQDDSERSTPEVEALDIIKDFAVDMMVGPENATYCRLEDPTGVVVFDGYSQCKLTVARVTMEHDGIWNMTIGSPGRVLTEEVLFMVNVKEVESDMVSVMVEYQQPSVILTCSVSRVYTVQGCTFRDPRRKTLVATLGGSSEDNPTARYTSNVSNHNCSLLLTNPLKSLLGVWRCAVETEIGTHYGFLSVTCPWLLKDPTIKDVLYLEPRLETTNDAISAIEGTVAMTCVIHAPISYCHFKASNGTKFSIAPETSSPHLEYVGSGFDAGECGVRFTNLVARDSGQWSCHVGLVNQTVDEQSFKFEVTIEESIIVQHYWHEQYGLVVEARAHSKRTLDSCRFVRSDGLAFPTDSVPAGYRLMSRDERHCLLQIEEAIGLNLHPWTIITSIRKHGIFTRNTTDNVFWFKQTAISPNVTGLQANDDGLEIQRTWLSRIDRVTRIGEHIDMSLHRLEEEELCYFISPGREDSTVNENIAGVTIHEPSTFVSCRITVGPIERSLIGNWTLCGRRTDTVIYERCQNINVTFNNNNNPSATWNVTELPQFNHSVSLGRYLTPVTVGIGQTMSCHIITPDGEDLVITHDTNYRNLELIPLNPSTMTCSVRIGPIERWMMGEWTLYGMYRRQANTEVRLPMRLSLYDEENPYTQPYNITTLDTINRNVALGRILTLEITGTGNKDECEYRPPDGQRYLFNATDHFPGVTTLDVGVLTICRITVGPVDELMFGSWELVGRFSNNGIFTERRQPFFIAMGDQDELEDTEWLPHIALIARTGQLIDITLSNMKQDEICSFENPAGERGTEESGLRGVKVHESSRYVSCRITVGPMEQSLIGNWTLCGNYGHEYRYERCQTVNISWHNNNNPSSNWQVNNQRQFNYSVSLNRFFNPVVESSGSIISCHIITPNGEDLVLTPDSQYPRLQVAIRGASCAFTIGPLEQWMLGDWTIYGMFSNRGFFENRLPMNLELFDEDNPYTQPYNITELDPINRIIPMGVTTTLEVTGSGNIDSCRYRAPTGEVYDFNAETHFPGVTIPAVGNSIVCRLSIGPIDKIMLGEWRILGQFRTNNGTFTERRQTVSLIEEDPDNPFIEEDREIMNLTDRLFETAIGQTISVSIGVLRPIVRETCHIRTPGGRQYIMAEHFNLPGVTPFTNQNIECGIRVNVASEDMIGEWVLISRGNSGANPVERRQRFIVHIEDPDNPIIDEEREIMNLTDRHFETAIGQTISVSIGVLRPIVRETCHIRTPGGRQYIMAEHFNLPGVTPFTNQNIECGIRVNVASEDMIGEWVLISRGNSGANPVERRQRFIVHIEDPDNPIIDEDREIMNLTDRHFETEIGQTITVSISVLRPIIRETCHIRTPSGRQYIMADHFNLPGVTPFTNQNIECGVRVNISSKDMIGEWVLISRGNSGANPVERRQHFFVHVEDPDNPIVEEDREIMDLDDRRFETAMGQTVSVTIANHRLIIRDTCHIRTPAGRQYIMAEHFNLPGVTPFTNQNVDCGVRVTVSSEDMIGEWVLISRGNSADGPVERRQLFIIYAEVPVAAFPTNIRIIEGNDLYIRLRDPTDEYETCELIGPSRSEIVNAINNTIYLETCGFIVKEVTLSDNGTWHIVYGKKIVYRASVNVTVIERNTTEMEAVDIIKDVSVNRTVGPEDATYCRLEDPTGAVVFDGFGQCRLTLERVTLEHDGTWDMFIGLPGSVLVERRRFVINVKEAELEMVVSTRVQKQRPTVLLTCSVPHGYSVRACKFRDPLGEVLVATQGIGEDRYVATNYQSNTNLHECNLRIMSPVVSDLGLWRCAVETNAGTHYGFLSVICPWLMQDPEVQALIVTEPILEATRHYISTIEGAVTMSCAVNAPISYCYFRARNGTTFSVAPETSSLHLEYVGSGFNAGECGVRFTKLIATDSGQWSCHVGLVNQTVEQRAQFQVTIEEPIVVQHYWHEVQGLVVEARVHSQRTLSYCRFVRIDGLGFTTNNIPAGFSFIGSLEDGHCLLQIEESNMLNLHPWTVAVRISGQTVELSRQTTDNLLWFAPPGNNFPIYLWFIIVLLSLIILVVGISLGTKKNRKWTFDKASSIRNSLRDSFKKPTTV